MTNKLIKIPILLLFTIVTNPTVACDCVGRATVEEGVKSSDLVVTGKIISKEIILTNDTIDFGLKEDSTKNILILPINKAKYKLIVLKKFKGNLQQDTLTIITGVGGGDCGFEFTVGQKYIIYAQKIKSPWDTYHTNTCSRTVSYDTKEIEAIKKAVK